MRIPISFGRQKKIGDVSLKGLAITEAPTVANNIILSIYKKYSIDSIRDPTH